MALGIVETPEDTIGSFGASNLEAFYRMLSRKPTHFSRGMNAKCIYLLIISKQILQRRAHCAAKKQTEECIGDCIDVNYTANSSTLMQMVR